MGIKENMCLELEIVEGRRLCGPTMPTNPLNLTVIKKIKDSMGGSGLYRWLVAYEQPFYDGSKWVRNGFLGHAFYHKHI